jgi:hypothetical protein
MAAPKFPILDDFNRADENPLGSVSTAWFKLSLPANFSISSNQLPGLGGQACAVWSNTPNSFFGDFEAYLSMETFSVSDDHFGVVGRWSASGDNDTRYRGYLARVTKAGVITIATRFGSTLNVLTTANTGVALTDGSAILFRGHGSLLEVSLRRAGVWAIEASVSDSTFAAGHIGMFWQSGGGAARMDNFGGGGYSPSFSSTSKGRLGLGNALW